MRFHLRNCYRLLWSFALLSTSMYSVTAIAQQPGNNGVAPRTPGYGSGTPANNRPAANNPNGNTPGVRPNSVNPAQGNLGQANAQSSAPLNTPQLNQQLNPGLTQAAQSKIEQAVLNGQQWQMQGPANGGQVVGEPPFPKLNPQEQQRVDQLLDYWQRSTADITQFSTDFARWEYDSEAPGVAAAAKKLGRSDIAISAAGGVIRYEKPDKGLFRTDEYLKWTGEFDAKGNPTLKKDEKNFGEWVICDGKKIHDYDRTQKICTVLELPPDMQGLGVLNSPLPFLFGVKADEIKARYWVREINAQSPDAYAIEAYPKYPIDAVNYHHVQIKLDNKQFLPVLLVLYMPEWSDKEINQNGVQIPARDKKMIYQFSNQRRNTSIFEKLNQVIFQREFIPHEPPADYKRNVIPYIPQEQQPTQQAQQPQLNQPNAPGNGERTANPGLPAGSNTLRPRG